MKPSWVSKLIRQISVATCWPRASSLIRNELKKAHRIARPVCIASKTNPNNHEFHSFYSKESYDQRCRFDCLGCRYRTAQSDRKSTRLNSSHVSISYAVFCLQKET